MRPLWTTLAVLSIVTVLAGAIAWDVIAIRRIGMDDHSSVRHLHAKAMTSQSADALSDAEVAAFVAFVRSVAYSDMLMTEDVHGAFVDGQLIGTAAWHVNGDDGQVARISSVFVHPLFARRGLGLLGGAMAAGLSQGAASACVPAALESATIQAASLFAVGQAATGAISVPVAALTEGVLKAMLFTKLKVATAILLAVALAGVGAARLLNPTQASEPPNAHAPHAPRPTFGENM